jgi:UDP-N-acetylmuramoylalanine--D-glutamate ligase
MSKQRASVAEPESRYMGERTPAGEPRTLVVGLGRTGLSCVRWLASRGVPVAVTDSRPEPPGLAALRADCLEVAVYVGGFAPSAFAAAQRLVVSPGVSPREPAILEARRRGAQVIGDIELFAAERRAPLVAITGSNGKSTVTTLVAEMARRAGLRLAVGGNLGTPALELLPAVGEAQPDLYVLELSSFHLELTRNLGAEVATVLNLSADHIDRHGSFEEYAASKARVYAPPRGGTGVAVVNGDDPLAAGLSVEGRRVLGFRLGAPVEGGYGLIGQGGREWLARGEQPLMPVAQLHMAGRHNQANALAALALGEAAGLPMSAMLRVLREFHGLPHRSQWVAELDGVHWYNDSKGTNVGATRAALEGLPGPLVLIAGGQAKGADFAPLREVVSSKVRAVVLIGVDAPLLAEALEGAAVLARAADMGEAVRTARGLARPGDRVVLSPACASFDMFRGYEDRGASFIRAVQGLARGDGGERCGGDVDRPLRASASGSR